MATNYTHSDAIISPDGIYRYMLWRDWSGMGEERNICMFIGLNPSTADASKDDPTIRRCVGFAKSFGCNCLAMGNLFAYRATDPQQLFQTNLNPVQDSFGKPLNDINLSVMASDAKIVIAAWGTHGSFLDRDKYVMKLIPNLTALRITKDGHPAHPLYLPKDLQPIPFNHPLWANKDK